MSASTYRSTSAISEVTSRSASAPLEPIRHHLDQQKHQSRPSPSLTKSATFIHPESDFGFQSKTVFDANKELQKYRSKYFEVQLPPVDNDIWKRPAPDFRPQGYAPKPPKRNSRDAMQPWKYGTFPGQPSSAPRKKSVKLRHSFTEEENEEKTFLTNFHILDPQEARVEFVREGTYHPGMYKMPKFHDFRQVSEPKMQYDILI